ncbi:tetratricopeptide repeat protein [Rhodopirellula bahusiensis]|uniref:Uncharacterized protein n=1 Tax=Rhodopirellula bahusiensis TaxID=2014065 RepID=A0A2G1WCT0_9BACT|nr:hypothetical protein [Rhodopirellula bahusiensis]PHQ36852.1 hypothetical protein CEE69_00150 [Rhodopirellula bahusiensis]
MIALLSFPLAVAPGCGKQDTPEVRQAPERPLGELRLAMRKQKWTEAWQYSDAVLEAHADDADAIASVAKVAQHLEKPDEVADLLVRACSVESFSNDGRVRQAMIALVAAGRLYDAIGLLEATIQAVPSRHATRRWLYDLYVNSGNRAEATSHGRILVRQRQFDTKLLLSLGIAPSAKDDLGSTLEIVRRNPDDKRPLLRQANKLLKSGQTDEATKILGEIIDQHPEFEPAQLQLGLAFAESGNIDAYQQWLTEQDASSLDASSQYWIAKATVAAAKGKPKDALQFFWNAGQRDPDLVKPWASILELTSELQIESPERLSAIANRLESLEQVRVSMERFDQMGSISRQLATDIALELEKLGRLWEAEAWASMATTLPRDDTVEVDEVRTQIVSRLTEQTPWQVTKGYPELQPELPSEFE